MSLCEKAERLAILPCLTEVEGMRADLERFDTVVMDVKVGRRFADLRDAAAGHGALSRTPTWLLKIGSPEEIMLTSDLDKVDPEKVSYMSLVIVRKPISKAAMTNDGVIPIQEGETNAQGPVLAQIALEGRAQQRLSAAFLRSPAAPALSAGRPRQAWKRRCFRALKS